MEKFELVKRFVKESKSEKEVKEKLNTLTDKELEQLANELLIVNHKFINRNSHISLIIRKMIIANIHASMDS